MVLEMMSPIDIATVMCLIGGLEHVFLWFSMIYGNNNANWRTHIFQRVGSTTNQMCKDPISG